MLQRACALYARVDDRSINKSTALNIVSQAEVRIAKLEGTLARDSLNAAALAEARNIHWSCSPRKVVLFYGARGTLLWSVVLCLLLLLGIAAGARWQVHSQTIGGAVLLWTATVLLGVVISDQNILIAPLDAFLLPSMALALVSSFTTLATGFVGQPNLR